MPQALLAIFTQIASVIGGALNGALGTAISMMQAGTKAALQFHQEGISLARDLGMGLNQANAYTKVLTERTQVLAQKYGVASSAITAVQRNISETTGKQLILNDAQAEGFVQANKLVGQETTNKFMDTIMNGMGGQVSAVQGAISKAYATASKQGLNAQKFSKKIAENLSMANRLNFRNGVDGITRMAAMAEKFGLSMKSVETAAGQFMELDSAIEHSAHLQMLGGSIGASFGNPLQNAYESMYDPEAFAKRMEDAMKGMATFDTKKGYATMSAMNQEILRNYAKEMGLNAEEVVANAKKMAEVRYKEKEFGGSKLNGLGLSEEQKNFLINNGQVKNGQLYYTDSHGKEHNVSSGDVDSNLINEMMQFSNMSDSDILKDQASHLKSIDETITGNASSVVASFAKGLELDKNAQNIIQNIDKVGTNLQGVAENLGKGANEVLSKILDWINKNGPFLKSIADGIRGVSKFLADNWGKLLIAIAGWKMLIKPALGANLGGNTTVGGKLASKALGGIWKGLKAGAKGFWSPTRDMYKYGYTDARIGGSGKIMSAIKAPFKGFQYLTKAQKLTSIGGAALGVGISAAQGIMAQSAYRDQLDAINRGEWDRSRYKTKEEAMAGAQTERNESVGGAVGSGVGTVIGTILGGPVGAMIGGAIGKFAGEYIGKNWTKITDWFSKGWNKVVNYFTSINWGKVGETLISTFLPPVGAIIQVVKHWDEISTWFSEKWDGAMSQLSVLWQDIKNGWSTYIEQPFKEYVLQPIKDVVKWTDENILQPVKSFFAKVKEGWDKLMGGIQKFLDDPWGSIKQGAKNTYEDAKGWVKEKWNAAKGWAEGLFSEKHASGGIVGGNSYSGDRILTGLNSGEMVLNKDQQAQLFSFINNASSILTKIGSSNGVSYYTASSSKMSNVSSNVTDNTINSILSTIFNSNSNIVSTALNTNNNIKTIPFGENSFKRIPKSTDSTNGFNGVNEIKMNDFNISLNGTIKLDGGNSLKNIDINKLLEDSTFISALKENIRESINREIHNGRIMIDASYMRGLPSPSTTWGKI